nr:unnamed protein product [Digitaria exilis]
MVRKGTAKQGEMKRKETSSSTGQGTTSRTTMRCAGILGSTTARSGSFRLTLSPKNSSMLRSSATTPSGSRHENPCTRFAMAATTSFITRLYAGHIRRPAPKGSSLKCAPRTSTPSAPPPARNLSGRNSSGDSGHDAGSRPTAHMFTISRVPAGMSDQEWAHRVKPHRLLHHGLDVGKVALGGPALVSHHAVELAGGGSHGVRVAEELHYGPLHDRRRGLRAAADDVKEERLDAVACQRRRLRRLLLLLISVVIGDKFQKHVHQVHIPRSGSPPAMIILLVLDEYLLVELVEHHMRLLHPPDISLHVEPPKPRHPLSYIPQQPCHRERLFQRSPERFAGGGGVGAATRAARRPSLPERHAKDVTHREAEQVLLHLHVLAGALEQAARQGAHLLRASVLERLDAARGEELGGAELARHAPVRAVGRLHDALVAIAEDLAEGGGRAVGEGEVVGLEDQPSRLLGGGDHDVEGAELEVHERRAMARRERGQHAVWWEWGR